MNWIAVDEVDSTNQLCRSYAEDGAPHGTVVLARSQRAGRGRLGRQWWAQPGEAVLMSVLIRRTLPSARVPLLTLGAAVAVAEAVPGLLIKWPNDLLSPDGRKVCGILAEAEFESGHLDFAIVGIGLNVHGAPDLPHATSLDAALPQHGHQIDDLASQIRQRLLVIASELEVDTQGVLNRWRGRAHTLGREVRVDRVEGVAVDVDAAGALIIETANGPVTVRAGDVHLV